MHRLPATYMELCTPQSHTMEELVGPSKDHVTGLGIPTEMQLGDLL